MICLYYGPITSKGQLSIGGYEAANRKEFRNSGKRIS